MADGSGIAAYFTPLDWGVLLGYLVLTTWLGARLAGEPATIRDFFRGGRKLPWYAVAGSIIATEISAVTFVVVPSLVFKPGGDFTYLQFGLIGSLLARLIVAYVLVPAYYEREIYSPYDYLGNRLGEGVKRVGSGLFVLGGVLGQAARVYLTAVVLELVLPRSFLAAIHEWTGLSSLSASIVVLTAIAVLWTLLGGITTVIWTDVILFFVFVVGALVALFTVAARLDGGVPAILAAGNEAGKFRFLDPSTDPTKVFTVWAALFAVTLGNVGQFGTDQLMAQRIFCCRDRREARRAMIASSAGILVTILVMLVGVGLYAFYREHPLEGAMLASYEEENSRIFPFFILKEVSPGLTGLIIAGIFAAAISSLDSILAALSQTAMATVGPFVSRRLARRDPPTEGSDSRQIALSRAFVVLFGVLLCLVAIKMDDIKQEHPSLLDLALALQTYSQGGLLAAFVLGFLPFRRDGSGLVYSVPLSVLAVFALAWQAHGGTPPRLTGEFALFTQWPVQWLVGLGALLVALYFRFGPRDRSHGGLRFAIRVAILACGVVLVLALNQFVWFWRNGVPTDLGFPWHAVVGFLVAFVFGYVLGKPRREAVAS
jgi:SSS family solute:Na+ symporter